MSTDLSEDPAVDIRKIRIWTAICFIVSTAINTATIQKLLVAHSKCNKHYANFYEAQDVLFRLRN